MRYDYLLYAVAIVFFIVTITAVVMSVSREQVWVVSTVVIGLACIAAGYTQRPRSISPSTATTTTLPPPPTAQPETQQHIQQQEPEKQQPEVQEPPSQQPEIQEQPTQQPEVTAAIMRPTPTDVVKVETPAPVVEPVQPVQPAEGELTNVKGIGEKRATQLKAIGIGSVDDLAKASAKDLAAKLKVSPKITIKWIESAKEIEQKD